MNKHSNLRPITRAAALVVSVLAGLTVLSAFASPAGAATTWWFQQTDSDYCYDKAYTDANRNGMAENVWLDLDNDCRWDTHLWNSVGGDGLLESLTFDLAEDGRWDLWLADTNQRAGYESVYYDQNGDGYYDWSGSLAQATYYGYVGGSPALTGRGSVFNLHLGDFWSP